MVDTHCHLYKKYYDNIDQVIKNMKGIIVVNGCDDETNNEVLKLIEKYDNVYGTLGFHPGDIDKLTKGSLKFIEDNLNNPKIVAIGEIGLDYYFTKDNKNEQQKLFIDQIKLANKYNKPIVIHARDSILDTYNILKKYSKTKKLLHCYSSSLEMAKEFIKLDCILGIGGVLTFKNSKQLKTVVENIDLKYLVLETDSPYLTPEPFRGQKNEPANVYYVANKIAELKHIDVESVLTATTKTAKEFYKI